jgi:predicted RNA-binding Zn-ribbon protein involved in translation (DUF1610 family)
MRIEARTTWGLPAAVTFAIGAAGLAWLGSTTEGSPLCLVAWSAGVVLAVLAIATVVWTAAAQSRREAERRKVARYACPRCGYAPDPADLEAGSSVPCPACGQPTYSH